MHLLSRHKGKHMSTQDSPLYKERFENLLRVAEKITATLNIGDILETIRDEVKVTLPHATEACLILVDPEAFTYTRPLHCAVKKELVNCQMCKRGKELVARAVGEPTAFSCSAPAEKQSPAISYTDESGVCEVALPVYDEGEPLAVLNVVTEEGRPLDERDIVLLMDLVHLATNTIVNAKKYSRIAMEKLTLEMIMSHVSPFVPHTVRRIVEKNPEAPSFDKKEIDVSILFLDVADYTRITESLTRDKVNFVIEKYFSAFLDIIYSHGGDVNETAGDGLMAIFQGGPDEHALAATTAAREIRQRTEEINRELQGRFFPLVVNMGVNSGVASVGMSRFMGTSGTRMTFTASGSVTNLASRLAASSRDGDILVGPETASRIRDKVILFDRGTMAFKNFRDAIHVYSLVPVERPL